MQPRKLTPEEIAGGQFADAPPAQLAAPSFEAFGVKPQQPLSAPAAPRKLSPEEIAAGSEIQPEQQPTGEAPGVLESGALGAAQGLTFGFGDELYGAANFLLSGGKEGSYTKARDEARGRIHAAEEAHPIVSTVGNVAGGLLIPGAGLAKAGTTLAGKALVGAGMGALGGLGSSEGQDIGEVGGDVLKSAAVGGVLFPVVSAVASKIVSGAPERAVKRVIGDITDGATATQRDRLVGGIVKNAEEGIAKVGNESLPTSGRRGVDSVLDLMGRDPVLKKGLRVAAEEPTKALRVVQDALESRGSKLSDIYGSLDEVARGAPVKQVVAALKDVAGQYGNPAERALQRQVHGLIADVEEQWGSGRFVPLRELRKTISTIQERGYSGGVATPPSVTKQLQRDTAGALKGVLDKRFDEIAETAKNITDAPSLLKAREAGTFPLPASKAPTPRTSFTPSELANGIPEAPTVAGEAKAGTPISESFNNFLEKTKGVNEIRQLNKDYSTLKNLEGVLEYRAQREASPSTTLKSRANGLLDMGLLATGNIPAFAAKKAYETVGKHILRFGDDKLAQLVMKARAGLPEAQIAKAALEMGLGNAALAPLLARWAANAAEKSGIAASNPPVTTQGVTP